MVFKNIKHSRLEKENKELKIANAQLQAELDREKNISRNMEKCYLIEYNKHRWIPVSERLPEKGGNVLFCWRPIDFLENPQHKEFVVGSFSYINEQGRPIMSPTKVWVNGMYYDIKTHITHWKPIILPEH